MDILHRVTPVCYPALFSQSVIHPPQLLSRNVLEIPVNYNCVSWLSKDLGLSSCSLEPLAFVDERIN